MPEGNPYDPEWSEDNDSDGDYFDDSEPTEQGEDEVFNDAMGEILSHYEEEEKEFNEAEAEFTDRYGFVHKCRCAQDWAEGNLGVVSVCYLNMVADAMDTLERVNKELKEAKRENARLRIEHAG